MSARGRGKLAIATTKVAIAVGLVYWLVAAGHLDLRAYGELLSGPQRWQLGGVFLLQLSAQAFFVARWHGLVQAQGIAITWPEILRTGSQGLFTQLFVPGGLGADGLRILHLQRIAKARMAAGLSSVVADRIVGVISLVVVALVAGLVHTAVSGNGLILPLVAVCATVLAMAAAAYPAFRLLAHAPLPNRLRASLTPLAEALRSYGSYPHALAMSLLISTVGHLLTGAAAYLCLLTLGAEEPAFAAVLAITCVLNLLRMIPITPMGLGVTDLAGEGLFKLIGLSLGAEQQMLMRIVSALIFLLAGAAFFWRMDRSPT